MFLKVEGTFALSCRSSKLVLRLAKLCINWVQGNMLMNSTLILTGSVTKVWVFVSMFCLLLSIPSLVVVRKGTKLLCHMGVCSHNTPTGMGVLFNSFSVIPSFVTGNLMVCLLDFPLNADFISCFYRWLYVLHAPIDDTVFVELPHCDPCVVLAGSLTLVLGSGLSEYSSLFIIS